MIRIRHAFVSALLMLAAPAQAQVVPVSSLPSGTTLAGTEPIPAVQSGHTVKITPNQIVTLAGVTLQAKDAQLDAVSLLTPAADRCWHWTSSTALALDTCTSFSRGLWANADAGTWRTALGVAGLGGDTTYAFRANNLSDLGSVPTARTNLGLAIGTNVQAWDADLDALGALTGTSTIYYRSASNTWSPVTIGTNLTFTSGTLAASGGGTVTNVSVTTANGVSGSVATSTTTPAISLTLGAITPTSVAASGTVTGSNLSGANTGDQVITLTGDVTGSGTGSFAATIGANKVTFGKFVAATQAAFVGATAAGNFGELTPTQATAQLNTFSSSLKGLAPASGGGTATYLRADGTWVDPVSVGSMRLFPSAPSARWLLADGSAYLQSDYPALYAAIGAQPDFGTIQTVVIGSSGVIASVMTNGSGTYVAAGTNGLYSASSLTGTWTLRQAVATTSSSGAWDGSQFMITENSGNLWTSPDGVTWTNQGAKFGGAYATFIQYLNGVYFAGVSASGLWSTTTAGGLSGWALRQGSAAPINVAYGGGRYVSAIGTTIYTSTNGTSFSAATVADSYGFAKGATVYDGSYFTTLGATGRAYRSSDGVNFDEVRPFGTTASFSGNSAAWDGTDILYPNTAFTQWFLTRDRFTTAPRLIQPGRTAYNQTLTVNNTTQFMVNNDTIALGTNGTAIVVVSKYSYNKATQFVVPNQVPLAVASALNERWYIYAGP